MEFQDEDRRDEYLAVANTQPSRLLIGEKHACSTNGRMHPKYGADWEQYVDCQLGSTDDHGFSEC